MTVRRLLAVVIAALPVVACTPPGLPDPLPPATSRSATGAVTAAPPTAGPTGEPADPEPLEFGFDQAPTGFNPHAVADHSLVTRTVAELVLPWVSRVRPDGRVTFDADLVDAAEVTATEPFTVTYRLRTDASWSDGTPITAEDFVYLWTEMRVQPGTVAPAGYRAIREVRSREAGKTVEVEFGAPVEDWVELFSPLLPSHLLRDSPGGWTAGLSLGLPVSGGPYRMDSYDQLTEQVTLVRNDKYWGTQALPPVVVLRFGAARALQEDFERGGLDALVTVRRLPGVSPTVAIPSASTVQLVLSATDPRTSSPGFRRAVGHALDRSVWADPLAPEPTLWPTGVAEEPPGLRPDGALADLQLDQDGWVRGDGVYRTRGQDVARVRLGYPADREDLAVVARAVQQQLAVRGIEVTLVRDAPDALVGGLAEGTLSMAVLERPTSVSASLTVASAFGCAGPPDPAVTPDPEVPAPQGNLSGYCRTEVDRGLASWVSGGTVSRSVLWRIGQDLPVVPLARPVWQVQVGEHLLPTDPAQSLPVGWAWTGPFASVAQWDLPD